MTRSLCSLLVVLASSVSAQPSSTPVGHVAGSAVGEVGARQSRDNAATGYEPLSRVDTRIRARIQNRLRTRIDRDYDPRATAASPFAAAEEQARASARTRRR